MAAEVSTFPLDLVKTRLQLQGGGAPATGRPLGAVAMARKVLREEGLSRGLYRGMSPALLRHGVYTSLRIVMYENMKEGYGAGEIPYASRAAFGAAAGVMGQMAASPFDLVKVRMMADGRRAARGEAPRYRGVAHALIKITREEGAVGLYRGLGPNVLRAALINCGELAVYDTLKSNIRGLGWGDHPGTHALSACGSGFVATCMSCPADVIKSRIMAAEKGSGGPQYAGIVDCLTRTVRHEGVRALYKGFLPTWTRLGPWQLTFWVVYEQLRAVAGLEGF